MQSLAAMPHEGKFKGDTRFSEDEISVKMAQASKHNGGNDS